MTRKQKHSTFIFTGCILWITSFFGEIFCFQPFSMIGIIISPILTITGIVFWLNYYKDTRGYYPRFYKVWRENFSKSRKNPFEGIGFLFKYILEFWTLCILFWMGLFLFGYLTFGQSKAFKETKKYCQESNDIISVTGNIKYYGFLVGGNISSHNFQKTAEINFTIIGENGNFSAKSELSKYDGYWEVLDVEINR